MIAGERTSGSVGAPQTRCKPDNQNLGPLGPERGHRRVEPLWMGCALRIAKARQSRTEAAVPWR